MVTKRYSSETGLFRWGVGGVAVLVLMGLTSLSYAYTVTLQWDPNPDPTVVQYIVYYGNAPRTYLWDESVDLSACDEFTCTISLDLPEGHWYFAVTAINDVGIESDFSEEIHTVLGSHEPLLIYPNGTITWIQGCTYDILWENFPGRRVRLDLLQDGQVVRKIARKTKNDGSFTWKVHKKLTPGSGFQVRVSSEGQRDESDDLFRIVKPVAVLPANGSVLRRGDVTTIQWDRETFCGPLVRIQLYKKTRKLMVISKDAPNTGSFDWLVPSEIRPGTKYRIRIDSLTNKSCRAYTPGYFTIE